MTLLADTDFSDVTDHLFNQDNVWFAPIRHHSPACAWALREMIRELKPVQILIEAPADYTSEIPLLIHEETRPPIAIVSLIGSADRKLAGYYPFCSHSPEYVALEAGAELGADLRFIDLASGEKAVLREDKQDRKIVFSRDDYFDSSSYTDALARAFGCRDGFELWDHLFESRVGNADWRAFFTDVGAYCAGMRASTHPDIIEATGDEVREAFMARCLAERTKAGPVVVVTGGFHTPALIRSLGKQTKSPKTEALPSTSYLIRYGFDALDALNGYAAGLPQPAYYEKLWQAACAENGTPDWKALGLEIVSGFVRKLRDDGELITVPAQVEMLRVAESLARLRGRPGVMRHDLFDGARAALIKGEANQNDVWSERLSRFLTGTQIGDIPQSAGSPPLVEDARARARANRIDVSDGAPRRRKLDIHRKDSQLEASRYFHAMALLETGFARRESGPDFVNRVQMDLLFEEWSFAWSPAVEGRLIELSLLGDQLPEVCLNRLVQIHEELEKDGRNGEIEILVDWLRRGLLAGLGESLLPFLATITNEIRICPDFSVLARSLRTLFAISATRGPLRPPEALDFDQALNAAFTRLVYLMDDLGNASEDTMDARLSALKLITEFLRSDGEARFDVELYHDAIDRVIAGDPAPKILGATLGICVQAGRREPDELIAALKGHFGGSTISALDQIGVLIGLLSTIPSLLWTIPDVMDSVDDFICSLSEDDFISILPHLRLAFSALNPRETEKLADLLASSKGYASTALTQIHGTASEAELHQGLSIELAIRAAIEEDQLSNWLTPETTS